MIFVIWISLASSIVLWVAIYVRIRRQEQKIPALDSTTELPDPPGGWPALSVIIPARNEEREIARTLDSLICQDYPKFELILVDDQSTDATARIAREILQGFPSGKIISGTPRPDDHWIGKSWALVQGVQQAKEDWLLFIDADVVHHPQAFKKGVAMAAQLNVDALSIMPSIDCRSFWEKCVMPLFALLSALLEPLDKTNHPEKSASRLSGAFILIKRSIYEAAGGHTAVKDQILEDMALAENLKKQGSRIWLTYTPDLTCTRMYDNFGDLWAGLTRLSFTMLNYSVPYLCLAFLAAFLGTLVPWISLLWGIEMMWHGSMIGIAVTAGGLGLLLFMRNALAKIFKVVKIHPSYAWLLPIATALYCLAATRAAYRHFAGQGLVWKQRLYQ